MLMIVFILCMCFAMYVIWGHHDDLSFLIILTLLLSVLYVVVKGDVHREQFTDGNVVDSFASLATLSDDVIDVLRPGMEHVIAAFKGEAKVEIEQKYDDEGNEINESIPDQVDIKGHANENEIRKLNRVLYDMRKFDPTFFAKLLAEARA